MIVSIDEFLKSFLSNVNTRGVIVVITLSLVFINLSYLGDKAILSIRVGLTNNRNSDA